MANRMILGIAPGKDEDSSSKPFVGKAGQLLDDIWKSVGMNTEDWYLTNCCLCRPIAEKGSGKQNNDPSILQRKTCRPYLDTHLKLLKPRVIVTMGRIPTEAILGIKNIRMNNVHGKIYNDIKGLEGTIVFPFYHPAALLHSRGNKQVYENLRQDIWDDIRSLKQILIKEGITK